MKTVMILAGIVLLSGCSPQERADRKVDSIAKTTLPDGMPCLIYSGGSQTGMSCDWDWKERKESN